MKLILKYNEPTITNDPKHVCAFSEESASASALRTSPEPRLFHPLFVFPSLHTSLLVFYIPIILPTLAAPNSLLLSAFQKSRPACPQGQGPRNLRTLGFYSSTNTPLPLKSGQEGGVWRGRLRRGNWWMWRLGDRAFE